jgi:hypothetical protein
MGRGIAPPILNLGIRWRRMASFMIQPLYPMERAFCMHHIEHWVGCGSGSDVIKRKTPVPAGNQSPVIWLEKIHKN